MVSYSATETSIRATWSSLGESGNVVLSYSIELYSGYSASGSPIDSAYNFSASSRAVNFYDLTPGAAYFIKLWGNMQDGSNRVETTQAYTESVYIPPPSDPTNFRVYDRDVGAIAFAWNGSSGATGYTLEIYHTATGNFIDGWYNFWGTSLWATGLVNGVTYDAKLYAVNDGGNSSGTWLYGIKAGYARPSNWVWEVTKTRGASYSLVNKNVTNLVTHSEIIAFQSRINEFRLYKNLDVAPFSSRSRGQVFTSTMYNELRSAIIAMSPPTQPSTSSNLIDLLNGLRNSLNSIP